MQIVVRSRHTNTYVGNDKPWTSDVSSARPFETEYHALYFCVSHELSDTDIVYRFPDGREVRFLKC